MTEILKSFKLRFYPTLVQEEFLNKIFGCVRFVWNKRVENFNSWSLEHVPEKDKTIKELKEEFPFLAEVPYNALEQKVMDFENTKKQYFNKKRKTKLGRMKFKSRRNRQSFRLSVNGFSITKDKKFKAIKLGVLDLIGYNLSELPIETCTRITIIKEPSGKYFVSILLKEQQELNSLAHRMVGIDLGIKDLFTLSNGEVINNPKWFQENQLRLKKAQQHLSRKQKGSHRRNKQRIKVAKIHEKIKFQRENFLHEVTTALVRNYDVICIENLNVAGMVKNHSLAKAISNASWSTFVSMLAYKCSWYGKTLVQVNRWFPSSKTCSHCGYLMDKMPLDVRNWICLSCGTHHDRDLNAARNILVRGFSDLVGEEFGSFHKLSSIEYIENSRGEDISLFDAQHHLASSLKR